MSDFEFDEHGIYREKPSSHGSADQGILVDEDGIWREDTDNNYNTYHTDSGFGTRKSSSSTLNKISLGADNHDLYHDLIGYRGNDLVQSDEKSLNISEFEASESAAGEDYSYGEESLSSEDNIDLPELQDESFLIDTTGSRNELPSDHRTTSELETDDYVGSAEGTDREGHHDNNRIRRRKRHGESNRDNEETNSIGYLLTSHNNLLNPSELFMPHGDMKLTSPDVQAGVIGDSIFSQQDDKSVDPLAVINQGGSLIEFERLEAELSESQASGDNLDLIGAYLQDLRDKDEADEKEAEHERHTAVAPPVQKSMKNDGALSHTADTTNRSGFSGADDNKWGSSIAFEESLIEDTPAPFNDTTLISLDMSTGENTARDRPPSRSKTPTRIPMLRSRSPSMSRPGSTSPTKHSNRLIRPASMEVVSPRRSDRGRSLPRTPGGSTSPQDDLDPRPIPSLASKAKSTNDLELDKAASLLVGGVSEGNVLRSESQTRKKPPTQPKTVAPNNFKIRGRESPGPGRKPIKAKQDISDQSRSNDISDTAASFEAEAGDLKPFLHESNLDEETYKTLQSEYNSLLKKYAEAENTIDDLRLGARVNLYSDAPAPLTAQQGKVVPAQQPLAFSMGKAGTAVMGVVGGGAMGSAVLSNIGNVGSTQVKRPESQSSELSSSVFTAADASGEGGTGPEPSIDETASLVEDGIKLALLAKAKDVEEQVSAFETLLGEEHLNLEDQQQALSNIMSSLDRVQQEYREARNEHEYLRRQGLISSPAGGEARGFDENKDVEGELYKLNMKLDGLHDRVQQNLKDKKKRKPFQGSGPSPMLADHSIKGVVSESVPTTPTSPAPIKQMVPGDLGAKLSRVNQDYNDLMKEYKRLKEEKQSPERDREIDALLMNLQQLYGQTSDVERSSTHLNDPMADGYNVRDHDSRLSQVHHHKRSSRNRDTSDRKHRREKAREEKAQEDKNRQGHLNVNDIRDGQGHAGTDLDTERPSRRDAARSHRMSRDGSDLTQTTPRGDSSSRERASDITSDVTSGMSSYIRPSGSRKMPSRPQRQKNVQPQNAASLSNQRSHKGNEGDRPPSRTSSAGRRLPKVTGRRRADKDSVNIGTEGSSLRNPRQFNVSKPQDPRRYHMPQGPHRSDARSPLMGDYSHSDSDSSADTVEEKQPRYQPDSEESLSQSDDDDEDIADSALRDVDRRRGQARYGSESPSDEDISDLSSGEEDRFMRERAHRRSHEESVLLKSAKKASKPVRGATPKIMHPKPLQPAAMQHNGQAITQAQANDLAQLLGLNTSQVQGHMLNQGGQGAGQLLSSNTGQTQGHGVGLVQGHASAQLPGQGTGQIQGHVSTQLPGHGTGQVQGHIGAQLLGHSAGQVPPNGSARVLSHTGQILGHMSSQVPVPNAGHTFGYGAGRLQGQLTGQTQSQILGHNIGPNPGQIGQMTYSYGGNAIYNPETAKISHGPQYGSHNDGRFSSHQPLSSSRYNHQQQRPLSPTHYADIYREAKQKVSDPAYKNSSKGRTLHKYDLEDNYMSDQGQYYKEHSAFRPARTSRHKRNHLPDENYDPVKSGYYSDGERVPDTHRSYTSPQRVTYNRMKPPQGGQGHVRSQGQGYNRGAQYDSHHELYANHVQQTSGAGYRGYSAPGYGQYPSQEATGAQYTPSANVNRHSVPQGLSHQPYIASQQHHGNPHNIYPSSQHVQPSIYGQPQNNASHVASYTTHGQAGMQPVAGVPNGEAVNSHLTAYPLRGGVTPHSHGEYLHNPAQYSSTSANGTLLVPNTGQGIPVQVVAPVTQRQRPPKVRYYVKEFASGVSDSEGESDGALNDSLNEALKEARKINKVACSMKKKINNELNEAVKARSSHV